MKKKAWLLCVLMVLLLSQCHENENLVKPSNQSVIETAKQFFNEVASQSPTNIPPPGDHRSSVNKMVLWENAYVDQFSIGDVVIVPVQYNKQLSIKSSLDENRYYSLDNLTRLFIYKDDSNIYHAEVVTSLPDKNNGKGSDFFSGIIRVEDWYGNFIKAFKYDKKGAIKKLQTIDGDIDEINSRMQTVLICTTVYGYNYTLKNPTNGYYYSETSCEYYTYDDGSDGGGSGGPSGGDYGGGGSGGSTPPGDGGNSPCGGMRIDPIEPCDDAPVEPSSIVNAMRNPCFQQMTSEFLSSPNEVSSMVQALFGNNSNLSLSFEDRVFPGGSTDYGRTYSGMAGNIKYAEIVININRHVHASKEFVASTLIHEAVHAYLSVHDPTNNNEDKLADPFYFNKMVNSLKSMFPHLDNQTATDLMWVGLENTQRYINTLSSADKQRIENTKVDYEIGLGTPCHD